MACLEWCEATTEKCSPEGDWRTLAMVRPKWLKSKSMMTWYVLNVYQPQLPELLMFFLLKWWERAVHDAVELLFACPSSVVAQNISTKCVAWHQRHLAVKCWNHLATASTQSAMKKTYVDLTSTAPKVLFIYNDIDIRDFKKWAATEPNYSAFMG